MPSNEYLLNAEQFKSFVIEASSRFSFEFKLYKLHFQLYYNYDLLYFDKFFETKNKWEQVHGFGFDIDFFPMLEFIFMPFARN